MKKQITVWLFIISLLFTISFSVSGKERKTEIPSLRKQGKTIESFIPKGWKLIKKASGDLNKDGLADIAGVIEYIKEDRNNGEEASPRILFIAFKEKDHYRLSIQTEKAILRSDAGGVWGDPLDSISVNRGSLLINFYGGSNDRWAYTYRFRFQDNGWFLIGVTVDNFNTGTGEGTRDDYNLLTGIMISATTKLGKSIKEKTINRGKKKLVNLKDFNVEGEYQF